VRVVPCVSQVCQYDGGEQASGGRRRSSRPGSWAILASTSVKAHVSPTVSRLRFVYPAFRIVVRARLRESGWKEFLVTDARGIGVTLTPLVVVMVGPVGVSAQAPSELAVDRVALVPPDDAPSQKINRDLRTHTTG